jgi:hypothetical protein
VLGLQVADEHGLASVEAVQAGTFVGLQLEQFQQSGAFGGAGQDLQAAALVGEHQAGRGRVQQFHAPLGQLMQDVCDVVVVDQGVGHLDERLDEPGLAVCAGERGVGNRSPRFLYDRG